MKKQYTVFVGGMEVSEFYLTQEQARLIADRWISKGYDDVAMVEVQDV